MRQQRTRDDRTMLVWDAAVRTFHWLLVLCFAGAWLTADSERFRLALSLIHISEPTRPY